MSNQEETFIAFNSTILSILWFTLYDVNILVPKHFKIINSPAIRFKINIENDA